MKEVSEESNDERQRKSAFENMFLVRLDFALVLNIKSLQTYNSCNEVRLYSQSILASTPLSRHFLVHNCRRDNTADFVRKALCDCEMVCFL